MEDEIKWWGYIHKSGTLHPKRYFGIQDIHEAIDSPFCDLVFFPYFNSREAVIKEMEDHLGNAKNN